jgi:hypothetical protein
MASTISYEKYLIPKRALLQKWHLASNLAHQKYSMLSVSEN